MNLNHVLDWMQEAVPGSPHVTLRGSRYVFWWNIGTKRKRYGRFEILKPELENDNGYKKIRNIIEERARNFRAL